MNGATVSIPSSTATSFPSPTILPHHQPHVLCTVHFAPLISHGKFRAMASQRSRNPRLEGHYINSVFSSCPILRSDLHTRADLNDLIAPHVYHLMFLSNILRRNWSAPIGRALALHLGRESVAPFVDLVAVAAIANQFNFLLNSETPACVVVEWDLEK